MLRVLRAHKYSLSLVAAAASWGTAAALDRVGMPNDEPFHEAVRSHVEFGSQVAMQNSHANTDDELHPLRDVPRWTWPGDEPSDDRADA